MHAEFGSSPFSSRVGPAGSDPPMHDEFGSSHPFYVGRPETSVEVVVSDTDSNTEVSDTIRVGLSSDNDIGEVAAGSGTTHHRQRTAVLNPQSVPVKNKACGVLWISQLYKGID